MNYILEIKMPSPPVNLVRRVNKISDDLASVVFRSCEYLLVNGPKRYRR
jgi:hypothetical protein